MSATATIEAPVLTAQDRCDRCTAAAAHIATLPSGLQLMFCGHHTESNRDGLVKAGATIA